MSIRQPGNRIKTDPRQSLKTPLPSGTKQKESRSYHYTDHVTVDNLKRSYYVFVPASYSRSQSTPVLLVFHGLKMSAASMTAVTGFNGVASRNNFIVVYCEAVNGKWNDGMNNASGVDDIKYVKSVLQSLSRKLNINQRRIYACGLSNGGYFCQMLASKMPDTIAGIAVVASTVMSQALTDAGSSKAIPAVFFFGSEDPLLNWNDGKDRNLGKYAQKLGLDKNSVDPNFFSLARYGGWMSVNDLVSYWVTRNRSPGSPYSTLLPDKNRDDGMRVKLDAYGSGNSSVHVYTIIGGTHSWPGALLLPGVKARSCQDISASEIIWEFFKRNGR